MKWAQSLQAILLWLTLALACFLPASALATTTSENRIWEISSIGYDAPIAEATDLESHTETSTSNYDTAPIHGLANEEIPTETNRALFGSNAEFKAAEGAGAIRVAPPGVAGWTEDGSVLVGGTLPRNSGLAGMTHPVTGIPFNAQGFPVFDSVATKTVEIEYTGTRAGDYAAANAKAGLTETPQDFVWHHVEDGKTMQLVPEDIHSATGHTGGFSLYPQN